MANRLRNRRGGIVVMGLLGLLILALGGFGATNFSGSSQTVAKVGDRTIKINDYARALQREIRAFSAEQGVPVNMEMAQALGIDRRVQSQLFAAAALDNEAARLGLSVGNSEVGKRILAIPAFQGPDGTFSRDTYSLTLQQEGMSEADFEDKLRDEAARGLLQGAVAGGIDAPATFVRTLADYIGETRSFTVTELLPVDLTEAVPAPTDAEIDAQYKATPDAYTRPETRRLTTVWLSPEMIADTIEVDEQALKDAYQARIGEFVIPEKRLVERLVFGTEDEAKAAKARIDAGEVTLADLAVERGLEAKDIDLGEVSKDDLGAAGDGVFALTAPGVAGPLPSDLGPALFAMNGILAAEETPFDEVRDDLAGEVQMDRARRRITEDSTGIEDLLASGASLEDVAKETGMELGTLALTKDSEGGLAGYEAFRKLAASVTETDFPTLTELDDGGVFALRLDGIDPPALKPLADVRDQVIADWMQAETHRRLTALAAEIQALADNGGGLDSQGLVTTRYDGFARGGFIDGAPPAVAENAFKTEAGKTSVIDADGRVFVVAVREVIAADPADAENVAVAASVRAQAAQGMAQDAFDLFLSGLEASSGVTVDQAALNAVHSQMQ